MWYHNICQVCLYSIILNKYSLYNMHLIHSKSKGCGTEVWLQALRSSRKDSPTPTCAWHNATVLLPIYSKFSKPFLTDAPAHFDQVITWPFALYVASSERITICCQCQANVLRENNRSCVVLPTDWVLLEDGYEYVLRCIRTAGYSRNPNSSLQFKATVQIHLSLILDSNSEMAV